jgi:putative peptide zinc metalloprotease protein
MLQMNPRMEVRAFDGSNPGDSFLCEVPTQDPNVPSRYVVPAEVLALVKGFDGTRETDQVVAEYVQRGSKHTPERLLGLIHDYCLPKGILVDAKEEFVPGPVEKSRRKYLRLRLKLIPGPVVAKLTVLLHWLFHWKVLLGLLPVFILTQIIFFRQVMPGYHFNLNQITGYDFFVLTGITTLFGIWHELGHASALAHYGSKRAEIGWGLYIAFTVLYTELSDAWRLKRTQRAMVDVGGIYFHCISLIFLLGLIYLTHWPMLVYCFFFIDLQIASSLNPFLRMDGYWLMGDLLGIPDLRKQSLGLLERLFYRVFRINASPINSIVPLSPRANLFVMIYTVIASGFFVYLSCIMLYQITFRLLPAYPGLMSGFWSVITRDPANLKTLFSMLVELLWKGLAIFGVGMFGYQCLKAILRLALRILPRSKSMLSVGEPLK